MDTKTALSAFVWRLIFGPSLGQVPLKMVVAQRCHALTCPQGWVRLAQRWTAMESSKGFIDVEGACRLTWFWQRRRPLALAVFHA